MNAREIIDYFKSTKSQTATLYKGTNISYVLEKHLILLCQVGNFI